MFYGFEHGGGGGAGGSGGAIEEIGGDKWDEKLEELVEAVTHHADEEERTILNGARENVAMERREELGKAFWEERERQLKSGCGSVDNVRKIVES